MFDKSGNAIYAKIYILIDKDILKKILLIQFHKHKCLTCILLHWVFDMFFV